MLRLRSDNTIEEIPIINNMTISNGEYIDSGNCNIPFYPITYFNSYPVYICTDKTKKAIEILKILQNEKKIDCKSVNQFISLVEKISEIL